MQVDGRQSVACYLRALELCYLQLCAKHERLHGQPLRLAAFDYCVFHAPFNKMARKAGSHLFCLDRLRWVCPPHLPPNPPPSMASIRMLFRRSLGLNPCAYIRRRDAAAAAAPAGMEGLGLQGPESTQAAGAQHGGKAHQGAEQSSEGSAGSAQEPAASAGQELTAGRGPSRSGEAASERLPPPELPEDADAFYDHKACSSSPSVLGLAVR